MSIVEPRAREEIRIQIPDLEARDRELIEEGRAVARSLDGSQMRLGKLALEFAPMGEQGYRSGARRRTELFAQEIGVDVGTLRNHRAVAHAWSVTDVGDDEFRFELLRALMGVGEKEKLLAHLRAGPPEGKERWTVEAAKEYAVKEKLLVLPPGRRANVVRAADRRTNLTVEERLRFAGDALAGIRFADTDSREKLDPLVARIEAEIGRLRDELAAL